MYAHPGQPAFLAYPPLECWWPHLPLVCPCADSVFNLASAQLPLPLPKGREPARELLHADRRHAPQAQQHRCAGHVHLRRAGTTALLQNGRPRTAQPLHPFVREGPVLHQPLCCNHSRPSRRCSPLSRPWMPCRPPNHASPPNPPTHPLRSA